MQKCILFSLIVICAIISAGCVVGSSTVPAATSATPTETTAAAVTTTPPVSMASLTEIKATMAAPKRTETTAKPMAAPITLQGKAGVDSASFTTVAPGEVSINWHYWAKYGEVTTGNCRAIKGIARANLVGKSTDISIATCGASSACNETKTFNLITPGKYSISVDGCNGWQATVSNAE